MAEEKQETQLPHQTPIRIDGVDVYPWNHDTFIRGSYASENAHLIGNSLLLKNQNRGQHTMLLAVDGSTPNLSVALEGVNLASEQASFDLLRGMNGQVLAHMDFLSKYGASLSQRRKDLRIHGFIGASTAAALMTGRVMHKRMQALESRPPIKTSRRLFLTSSLLASIATTLGALIVRNSLQAKQAELLPEGRETAVHKMISLFGDGESADNIPRSKILLHKLRDVQEMEIISQVFPGMDDLSLALGTDHLNKRYQRLMKQAPQANVLTDLLINREAEFMIGEGYNDNEILAALNSLSFELTTSSFTAITTDAVGIYSSLIPIGNHNFLFHPDLAPAGLLQYETVNNAAEQYFLYAQDVLNSSYARLNAQQ